MSFKYFKLIYTVMLLCISCFTCS